MTMTLQEFYEQIKDCQKCTLASSRTQVVFGHGNPQAEIMFVGEAPGFHEDRQGGLDTILPFIWWRSNGRP
jgi:uracil-DNA glycosylase